MWTQETGKQIVSARVGGDLLTGERQARSDCQLRQAAITRTEKKTVGLCDKERTVTINFGSGRKLKSQDLHKKGSNCKGRGRIGGDGHTVEPYVRHNTDESIPFHWATATGSS